MAEIEKRNTYDVIIGLEFHVETKTQSKMFCSCSADHFEKDPNSQVCPVCLGLPGALPVPNKKAVELCVLTGLAFGCKISRISKFDRKHYWYPDLPKGYQISQYDIPFCTGGSIIVKDQEKNISCGIERIHQEEDVAKILRKKDISTGGDYALIDFNKSGVPLVEIVTKPEIKSAHQAKLVAEKIRQTVRYLGISDADMEKGQMRCEPNISVQISGTWKYANGKILPVGKNKLKAKVEVKNIGSITAVENAIEYEVQRIIDLYEKGEDVRQQTRGWDPDKKETVFQRYKETSADYRYFPEPDIPPIIVDDKFIKELQSQLTELPDEKEKRFINEYGLSEYNAKQLTSNVKIAQLFEEVVSDPKLIVKDKKQKATLVANWIIGPVFAAMSKYQLDISKIDKSQISVVLTYLYVKKSITQTVAKDRFDKMMKRLADGKPIFKVVDTYFEGSQISSQDEVDTVINKVIKENPKPVEDYKSGKTAAMSFLVGLVMRETKGRADPNLTQTKLAKLLK